MKDTVRQALELSIPAEKFTEFYLNYLNHLEETKASYQTIRRYRSAFEQLVAWLESRAFTRDLYVEWMTECEGTLSPTSLKSVHSQMNSLFKFLERTEAIIGNPIVGLNVDDVEFSYSSDFQHLTTQDVKVYYTAALGRYTTLGDEDSLYDWVCIELMYTLGITPSRIPSVVVDLLDNTCKCHSSEHAKVFYLRGPVLAMQTMARFRGAGGNLFYGEWLARRDMNEVVARALRAVKRHSNLKQAVTPRDFAVNLCGRLLEQGADLSLLHEYTGRSFDWCTAVMKAYKESLRN